MKTIGINSECIEYGHPKRGELPDVNIYMGAQSFNTDRASLTVSRAARLFYVVRRNIICSLLFPGLGLQKRNSPVVQRIS